MKKTMSLKYVIAIAIAAICALALFACSGNQQNSSSQDSGKTTVKVGYFVDKFSPTYKYEDSRTYKFFTKIVAEDLNWDVQPVGVKYDEIEKAMNDGTIDCLFDAYTMEGRESNFAWSAAYEKAMPILICKPLNNPFGNAAAGFMKFDSATLPTGQTIGAVKGYKTYSCLDADQKTKIDSMGTIKYYDSEELMRSALESGEISIALDELGGVANSKEFTYIYCGASNNNDYGVAFKKGNEEKVKQVIASLQKLYDSGKLKDNFYNVREGDGYTTAQVDVLWNDFQGAC